MVGVGFVEMSRGESTYVKIDGFRVEGQVCAELMVDVEDIIILFFFT